MQPDANMESLVCNCRYIEKRDGSLVPFNASKIIAAIHKAGTATGDFTDEETATHLAGQVLAQLNERYLPMALEYPGIEEIQDIVESVLSVHYPSTATAYQVYRDDRNRKRVILTQAYLDLIDGYIKKEDWRVNENANTSYSLQGLNNYIASEASTQYWMHKVYPKSIRNAHMSGDIHVHDTALLAPYTYYGQEVVLVEYHHVLHLLSFEMLYFLVDEQEKLLSKEDDAWAKYPTGMKILDKGEWTPVKRLIRKARVKPMWYTNQLGGRSVIVTEDHPMLVDVTATEVEAKDLVPGKHKLLRVDMRKSVALRSQYGRKRSVTRPMMKSQLTLTPEIGYFIGSVIAKGKCSNQCINVQFTNPVMEETLVSALGEIGGETARNEARVSIPNHGVYTLSINNASVITFLKNFGIVTTTGIARRLPSHILNYDREFVNGVVSGIIDAFGALIPGTIAVHFGRHRTLMQQVAMILNLENIVAHDHQDTQNHQCYHMTDNQWIKDTHYILTFRQRAGVHFLSHLYTTLEEQNRTAKYTTGLTDLNEWSTVTQHQRIEIRDPYIYDITTGTHTLVVNGMWNHNCVGWDLKDLLMVGFKGVPGKPRSAPAKHFSAALGQIWNFLYTLQGESAGAQALSNFDTLLAPFIRLDNLTFEQVKQQMQAFMFNMNTSTRVGFQCVPTTYRCLTPDGWKHHHELKVGDQIFVFDLETGSLKVDTLLNVLVKEYRGKMVELTSLVADSKVLTTPEHMTVYRDTFRSTWTKSPANDIIPDREYLQIPIPSFFVDEGKYSPSDVRASEVFTIAMADEPFVGDVWCPTTLTGTFVCRTPEDIQFITGNCPFTNVSMDLTVPKHMKDEAVIIGGKLHPEWKYGDFQAEMDLFNKAFTEVMIEGDADGRLFSFPIPTYNVTPDFQWDNPNYDTLWKLTGKYGVPYFTNYVNSGMDPNAIRAMCPIHPNEKVELQCNSIRSVMRIGAVYEALGEKKTIKNVHTRLANAWVPVTQIIEVGAHAYAQVTTTADPIGSALEVRHEQPVRRSEDQRVEILQAKQLQPGMWLPYGKKMGEAKTFRCEQGFWWYEILDVVIYQDPDHPKAYCFVVDTPEHLFQLESGLITHNCRLLLDNTVLMKRGGGLFGSAPLTGSIGVVTINLPRIGYLSDYDPEHKQFYQLLDERMEQAKQSLLIKRRWLEARTEHGMYPFSKFYLRDVKARHKQYWFNHFSTIGINGMNEACLNYLGVGIGDPKGREFALEVLNYMRDKITAYQEETGTVFNLEATPEHLRAAVQ